MWHKPQKYIYSTSIHVLISQLLLIMAMTLKQWASRICLNGAFNGRFSKIGLFRHFYVCSPQLDNIRVMVIVWWVRGNVIRTALCWIVWHNVHSQQHTYMSSSYRSNRLGLSHWDSYSMRRGGCLELYYRYCNMVEWFCWDLSLISRTNGFNCPRDDL